LLIVRVCYLSRMSGMFGMRSKLVYGEELVEMEDSNHIFGVLSFP
jgi:hypothetical protein